MPRFFSEALSKLGSRYKAKTSSGPTSVDFASPIALVDDVSRMRDLGAIETAGFAGGLWGKSYELTHAGADTQEGSLVPSTDAEIGEFFADTDSWGWLMFASLVGTAGTLPVAIVNIGYPVFKPNFKVAMDLLFWRSSNAIAINESVATFVEGSFNDTDTYWEQFRPMPVLRGGSIRLRVTSAAAGTTRVNLLGWVGPIGVFPPGMS